jgi:hypothetical protein
MRIVPLIAALMMLPGVARADDPAPAPTAWLCMSPRTGPFNECWKGNSLDEADVERCLERQRARTPRPSRLKVGGGAWVEFPRKGWRCVALPPGRPMIAVENYGRTFASWKHVPTSACPAGVFDLTGPNFYGAMYARCSRRDHTRDERVP